MKEIELILKVEEDLEVIWDYSFRQFGVVQVDVYIGCIVVVFDVLVMYDIGMYCVELGEDICLLLVEQYMIYFVLLYLVVMIICIFSQFQDMVWYELWI